MGYVCVAFTIAGIVGLFVDKHHLSFLFFICAIIAGLAAFLPQ